MWNIPKLGKMHLSSAEKMIPHLKELGIRKAVLMSGCEKKLPMGKNSTSRKICEKYPEYFAWMCMLDDKNPETVYDRLALYKSQGAIGVGEMSINKRLDDPFLQAVFTAAEKLNMPITIHMSPEVGYSYGVVDEPRLPLLENVLKTYPKLKILGHSQTFWIEMSKDAPDIKEERNSWGKGPVVPGGRVPELFAKYENLYGDLSAGSGGSAIMRDEAFGLWFLETFQDRLFFATDMLNTETVQPLASWMEEKLREGKMAPEAYEKILRGNALTHFNIV